MNPNPNALQGYGSGEYGNPPIEALPLSYYLELLTSQYWKSEKLIAFLTAMLQKFDDISQCLITMDMIWDIDNAVGPQLDQVGAIVGANRTVGFQPSNGVSPILDDNTYRIYIKAKIAQNQWSGTIDGLYSVWKVLFPGGNIVIADNQNMTANIILTGSFTSITKDLIENGYIVPRPQGVLYNYVFPTLPAFGVDLESGFVSGVDVGFIT